MLVRIEKSREMCYHIDVGGSIKYIVMEVDDV